MKRLLTVVFGATLIVSACSSPSAETTTTTTIPVTTTITSEQAANAYEDLNEAAFEAFRSCLGMSISLQTSFDSEDVDGVVMDSLLMAGAGEVLRAELEGTSADPSWADVADGCYGMGTAVVDEMIALGIDHPLLDAMSEAGWVVTSDAGSFDEHLAKFHEALLDLDLPGAP